MNSYIHFITLQQKCIRMPALSCTHQISHIYTLISFFVSGRVQTVGCEVEFWHHCQPAVYSPLDQPLHYDGKSKKIYPWCASKVILYTADWFNHTIVYYHIQTIVSNLGVDVWSTLISSCQPLAATHHISHFYTLIHFFGSGRVRTWAVRLNSGTTSLQCIATIPMRQT